MLKHLQLFAVALIAALAVACSGNDNGLEQMLDNVDYYPVRVEGQKKWSMMAPDGTILFNDSFPSAPTAAVEGVFSTSRDKGVAVCRIQPDGTLATIIEGLRHAGVMNGGRMPVCRPDSSIEVIDETGAVVFSLDAADGHNFNASGAYYSCGVLTVRDCSTNLWGAVDRNGKIVVEPEYDFLSTFENGHAMAIKEGKVAVVDTEGGCKMLDGDYELVTGNFVYGHSIVIKRPDGVRCVVDTKGDVATPDRSIVAILLCRQGAVFMNHLGEYGVVGYDGEVAVVPARRELLMGISGTDLMLICAGGRYSVLEANGKTKGEFPATTEKVVPLYGGSGYMVQQKGTPAWFRLFSADLKPLGDVRVTDFGRRISFSDIMLSDREEDHRIFNNADPGDELPDWMEPDEEEKNDSTDNAQ